MKFVDAVPSSAIAVTTVDVTDRKGALLALGFCAADYRMPSRTSIVVLPQAEAEANYYRQLANQAAIVA